MRLALARLGIGDLYTALAEREDVFMLLRDGAHFLKCLSLYMQEHYGFAVTAEELAAYPEFTVCRIRRQPRERDGG